MTRGLDFLRSFAQIMAMAFVLKYLALGGVAGLAMIAALALLNLNAVSLATSMEPAQGLVFTTSYFCF